MYRINMPTLSQETPPASFVPSDLDEMYRRYYLYLRRLITHNGIDYQNADDVVQKIFIKVLETGMLEDFDPSLTFNDRAAVFKTFLSGFALKYLRHHRQQQNAAKIAEQQLMDTTTVRGGENLMWGEVHGPTFEEEYYSLYEGEFMDRIRAHLATVRPKRKDSQLNFVAFFEEIAKQVSLDGTYSTTTLSEVFGVSRTSIHNWLNDLRAEISKVVVHVA